jgi:hypothetical protein
MPISVKQISCQRFQAGLGHFDPVKPRSLPKRRATGDAAAQQQGRP